MQGGVSRENLKEEFPNGISIEFDLDQLPNLDKHQVVFFDETHLEQEGLSGFKTKYQLRFPRNNEGRYCPESATNPTPQYAPLKLRPSFKYAKQGRFCLGVAAICAIDGRITGKRSVVFDYSGQRLISIKQWKERLSNEIKRVKTLKISSNRSKWLDGQQSNSIFHDEDDISKLPRVGKGKTYQDMIQHPLGR